MQQKLLAEYWQQSKTIIKEASERTSPEFPTGLAFLDEVTGGFRRGEVWIIAGKTSCGKTSLALNLARNFAENPEHTILFCSLEMRGWELTLRLYCEMMEENYSALITGVNKIDEVKEKIFVEFINNIDFDISEAGYNFNELLAIFDKFYKEKHPDVIFLDFIQLVEWREYGDERMALTEYIRKIKELANKYNIGFVVVSQLRRLPSGADYQREPDLNDMKGSGAIEQYADKCLLIYRQIEGDNVKHFINLAKNRQGQTICKQVEFIGCQYKFKDFKPTPEAQNAKELMGGRYV